MNFVSLFAGVGGFDLAFERAGMECVGQVEIDNRCREVLAKHWPDVPRFEDVHEVSASHLLRTRRDSQPTTLPGVTDQRDISGRQPHAPADVGTGAEPNGTRSIDILCGGFPCQDYSVAGKRGGLAGDRGALWWQFHRLIDECRPEWVVGENVPGLLSSSDGRDFGAIVGSLVELGYGVVWRVLDAQYFGVAQRRRRVFIVGHSGGQPRPEILAFAEGCAWDTPPVREAGAGAADHAATSLKASGKYDHVVDEAKLVVAHTLTQGAPSAGRRNEDDLNLVSFNWQSGGDVRLSVREAHTDALHSGQVPAVAFQFRGREGGVQAEVEPDGIVGSLRAGDGGSSRGRMVAAARVRRLTPLECERLQGFPDNWTAGQSDTQRYRQMGNAVAVPVVEWIGRNIAKAT